MNKIISKMIKTLMVLALALVTVAGVGATKASAYGKGSWSQATDGRWFYYYDNDGTMAYDTLIDGKYVLGDDGSWAETLQNTSAKTRQNNNTTGIAQIDSTTVVAKNDTISYAEFTKIADDKMLELINAHRAEKGINPMEWDQTLADMSTEKDEHMIKHNYMEHVYLGQDTSWVQSVAWNHHIDGENCLANYSYNITREGAIALATSMFNQWKASPGHNASMLDSTWVKFGFGFAFSNGKAQYASYGTQQFACKHDADEPPMAVTDENTGRDISNPRFDIGGINNIN